MKQIFLSATAALLFFKAFPQNVGIGTIIPLFKLDVAGGSINTDSLYRIGTYPVLSVRGNGNVFVGLSAGHDNIGSQSVGYSNTALGQNALYKNIIGNSNVACGSSTLEANIQGSNNTSVGEGSLLVNYSGDGNTGCGARTLAFNTTGSNNTGIGRFAGVATASLSYTTAIGANADVACSNCLVLGGTSTSHTYVGINNSKPLTDLHIIQYTDAGGDKLRGIRLQRSVSSSTTNHWRTLIDPSNNYVFEYNDNLYTYINLTTGAYINPSDARLKKDITPLSDMLDKVMALTPEKFHYKTNKDSDPLLWGFIAQDVQKIFPEFIDVKDDGYLGIAYSNFSIVAIKAIQEQQKEIDELKNRNEKQQKQINTLQKQNELQQMQYDELKKEIELLKARSLN